MLNFVFLTLLIIVGVLVNPASWGFWGKFVFKAFILIGSGIILYRMWVEFYETEDETDSISSDDKNSAEPELMFFENRLMFLKKSLHRNSEMLEFLRKQFAIIWNLILPHNGYLFLMLPNREVILLHKKIRENMEAQKKGKPIPVLDLIDNAKGFLVENHVENGLTLLPFYSKNDFTPRSFLGFRLAIGEEFWFYWIFDAEVYDFFNHEDRAVLHKINETTLTFINKMLLAEKLKEENVQTAKALTLAQKLNLSRSIPTAVNWLTDFLIGEFQATKLTIAFRKNFDLTAEQGVINYSVGLEDSFKPGKEFPLEDGLNGWVILKNRPYLLDDIDKGEYFIPRFSREEKTNYGLRSFLSVPVRFNDQAIGMITLEDKESNKFSIYEKERLIKYAELFSTTFNRLIHEKQIGG